ncbi:MAG: DUF72 domain-containing protein [Candidatus Thorarchaeota archaeon]
MTTKVLIGTSGWGYDEWIGPFYPKSLKKEDFLLYYSEIFYTNEINTTFYNIPSRWIVENWANKTPQNFLFSAKIPQTVTHENMLDIRACMNDLERYLRVMEPLIEAKKLLSFLIQLPPFFNKKEHFNTLKEFIDSWPGDLKKSDYYLVVEFRHKSWMTDDVFKYLKQKLLTYCAVIEPLLPPRMDITNPEFAYIRFHGYGDKIWFDYFFKEEEIRNWAHQINEIIPKAEKIGIYFNNHFSGYAAKNALMLMKELNLKPKNSPEQISILNIKKKSGEYSKGQTDLGRFLK